MWVCEVVLLVEHTLSTTLFGRHFYPVHLCGDMVIYLTESCRGKGSLRRILHPACYSYKVVQRFPDKADTARTF
jgi:hypothetical protein